MNIITSEQQEIIDKAVGYLDDDKFDEKVGSILTGNYKEAFQGYFKDGLAPVEVGNIIKRSDIDTQKIILKMALSLVNLYESNDYTKHSDLSLKIYFDMFLRNSGSRAALDMRHIDFVFGVMPERIQERVQNKFFPGRRTNLGMDYSYWESLAYHVFRHQVIMCESNPDFYSMMADKELFDRALSTVKPGSKRNRIIKKYVDLNPTACYNYQMRTEGEMCSNIIGEVMGNLVRVLQRTRDKRNGKTI